MNKRYIRNIAVEGVGIEGQKKISNTTALIFGIGGLGSTVALHLSVMGFKKIILVDEDIVTISNLQRQFIYTEKGISKYKVIEAKKAINKINKKVEVVTVNSSDIDYVFSTNEPDIIFDCTDNYDSRLLISRNAKNKNIPLCSASAVEWQGWLCMFDHIEENFNFENIFKEKSNYKNCDDKGILSPSVSMIASMQVLEATRFLLKLDYANDTLILINTYMNDIKKIKFNEK